jgi:hypothetical protein
MKTRSVFEQALQCIQAEVLTPGGTVEWALVESVWVLKKRDVEGAHRLIAEDRAINELLFSVRVD